MDQSIIAAKGAKPREIRRSDRAKLITDMDATLRAHASRAEDAVKLLGPCVKAANDATKRVAQRKDKGELDTLAASAELAPAAVVLSLADSLQKLLDKATGARDGFTLRCIRTAAITLRAHADSGILNEGQYPKDGAIANQFVHQNFSRAAKAHADVLSALGNTHLGYNIEIPEPPAPPTSYMAVG